jgi:phosphatidylglycerol---prolipoprotein diacylglyceryl transferase
VILGIDWKVTSELIDGWATPNKYGLLFVSGLIIGFYVIKKIYKSENISDDLLDKLLLYTVIATIVGARLGHVLFYGPYFDVYSDDGFLIERGYFSNPIDIFKVWEGGLASHGGAIAIIIALWIYSRKIAKKPIIWILDRIVISASIAACFIRLGNLVNHEIIGIPTDLPWGFKFNFSGSEYLINGEHVFRHPAQLYEAILYFLIFLLLLYMYWKTNLQTKPGILFGTFLVTHFTARFMVEFIKIGQTYRDDVLPINTGQMLSIPFILIGVYFLIKGMKAKENSI